MNATEKIELRMTMAGSGVRPDPNFMPPDEVNDLVDQLLDAAVVKHYDRISEETLLECRVCGMWEDHAGGCPIPALSKWLKK